MAPVMGRSPAVEPVKGLSIEEYDQVPPSKARGFDFSQQKKEPITKQLRKISSTSNPNNNNWSASLLVFFLFAIPFIMWFGVMRSLKDGRSSIASEHNELLSIQDYKKDSTDSNDHQSDIDIPKAS